MQLIRSLIQRLSQSISDVYYYKKILKMSVWQGFLFFTWWMVIIGVMQSSYYAYIQLPELKFHVKETIADIPAHYPEDLEIFVSNNTMTLSQDYLEIPLPETWLSTQAIEPAQTPELLAVLTRTKTTPSQWVEESEEHRAPILYINHNSIYVNNFAEQSLSNWTEFQLSEVLPEYSLLINSGNISKTSADFQNQLEQYFPYIQAGAVIGLTSIHFVSRIFVLLFESLFIYILLRIYGKSVPIPSVLNFGLHLMIPAEIINQFANIVWPESPISFLSLSFWILAIFILYNIRDSLDESEN